LGKRFVTFRQLFQTLFDTHIHMVLQSPGVFVRAGLKYSVRMADKTIDGVLSRAAANT
jgi:hypothetical protein